MAKTNQTGCTKDAKNHNCSKPYHTLCFDCASIFLLIINLFISLFRCASLTCLLLVCLHRCVLVLSKAGCQCCTPCNTQSLVFRYFLFTVLQVVVCVGKWKIKWSPKCPVICVAKQQYSEEDLSSHCGRRMFFLKFQNCAHSVFCLILCIKKNSFLRAESKFSTNQPLDMLRNYISIRQDCKVNTETLCACLQLLKAKFGKSYSLIDFV